MNRLDNKPEFQRSKPVGIVRLCPSPELLALGE